MKKIFAILTMCVLAVPALAAFEANLGPSHSTLGGQGGGSFGVDLRGDIPGGLKFGPSLGETWSGGARSDAFGRTFCVEDVTFQPKQWYTATVDSSILYGGPGQLTTLTDATRTVFAHFALDTGELDTIFTSLGWGSVGGGWNRVMQAFIWDQQLVDSDGDDQFGRLNGDVSTAGTQKWAYDQLATLAATNSTGFEDRVRVLNLWSAGEYAGDKQSQLVLVVPAPAAALLGLLGVTGFGMLRRKLS